MIDDSTVALRALAEASKAVQEYAGSELSKHMDDMLTALADGYRLELANIGPENLLQLQAKLKQTLAIRSVIRGEMTMPRT